MFYQIWSAFETKKGLFDNLFLIPFKYRNINVYPNTAFYRELFDLGHACTYIGTVLWIILSYKTEVKFGITYQICYQGFGFGERQGLIDCIILKLVLSLWIALFLLVSRYSSSV